MIVGETPTVLDFLLNQKEPEKVQMENYMIGERGEALTKRLID